jgi:hypothetical protein
MVIGCAACYRDRRCHEARIFLEQQHGLVCIVVVYVCNECANDLLKCDRLAWVESNHVARAGLLAPG